MRYEGNAPQYSTFALVAIESVWPNPEGNELSPDAEDMSLIGASSKPYKTTVKSGMSPVSGVESEEDYHGKNGYYKILPLNITQLETTTSVEGGSSFRVSFTLDDLVLVIPKKDEEVFRYATGLPISRNDLIESDFPDRLPQLIKPSGSSGAEWEYVKDSDLGLGRYRINGSSSSFNVEDLVDVNDTVTIWIYHDPQDFYLKDGVPSFDGEDLLSVGENHSITNIIGSGDRQNQFSANDKDFDETLLFSLGLANEVVKEAIALSGEDSVGQISVVDKNNISEMLLLMSQESGSGILSGGAYEKISDYVRSSFGLDDGSEETVIEYITDILATLRRIKPQDMPAGPLDTQEAALQGRVTRLNSVINSLKVDENGDFLLFTPDFLSVSPEEGDSANALILRDLGFEDPVKFVVSLNLFKNSINEKARNYAINYLARRSQTVVSQGFTNGRTILLNKSHGETPYLALKGVISGVKSVVGTVEGTNIITIEGSGYEKVLTSNEVFYEDLLYPEASFAPLVDYNTVYMNMSPPRAIQHIISRWAARQVIFGKPTAYSILAFNRSLWLRAPLGKKETEETTEEQQNRYRTRFPGKEEGIIPIRGTFVYSDYVPPTEQGKAEYLRVFSPLNYLDTTRIREMVITLDKSYRNPAVEGAINTAQQINGRESIMSNLRRVGGVADFYEMFVDESGRFRYRLKFEAIERTPDTSVTPIIQDYEVLSSGSVFSISDAELKTIVDVSPILNRHVSTFAGLPFIGRSVPPSGKLPLQGVEDDIPPESLSPDLFKYGIRTLPIQDLYQSERGGARRKAHLYRMFYGKPIKKATISIRNNTSFRAGETVLLSLQKNKKRSRSVFDVNKMIEWLTYLAGNKELREMYIGIEKRFLSRGKDSYIYTGGEFLPIPEDGLYGEYVRDPHMFVLNGFLKTFEFLKGIDPNITVFTPDYFPTTYWYHQRGVGGFRNWDQGNIKDEEIIKLYSAMLNNSSFSREEIMEMLTSVENQGIINAIKFQNFRAASYYIESVSHMFNYGSDVKTVLNLNYGQDNLVLLEPQSFLPIGFLSIEKKMKIGYDDMFQRDLWNSYSTDMSAMQKMYINQFKEDAKFKEASFLHLSQYFKNSSNYMYELANFYRPMPTELVTSVNVSEDGSLQPTREQSAAAAAREVRVMDTEIAAPELSVNYRNWKSFLLVEVREVADRAGVDGSQVVNEVLSYLMSYERVAPNPNVVEASRYLRDNYYRYELNPLDDRYKKYTEDVRNFFSNANFLAELIPGE